MREGFRNMLAYMLSNGARTIIVENACGFHACRPVIPADAGPAFHVMPGRV
jgi:hypothetical protein